MLRILIWSYKNRPNRKGMIPLYVRITLNKERQQWATGFEVPENKWSACTQKIKGRSSLVKAQNESLDQLKAQLLSIYNELSESFESVTAKDIKAHYQQEPVPKKNLLEVFDLYLERIKGLVGKGYSTSTVALYSQSRKLLYEFIRLKWTHNDVRLDRLKKGFADELIYYLTTEKTYESSTIQKVIQRLKTVVNYAVDQDYLEKNPFHTVNVKKEKKAITFLSQDEIKVLCNQEFSITRLSIARDLFLFQLYTSLGYAELKQLKYEHLRRSDSGWLIKMERQKTGKLLTIPVLPKAQEILEQYRDYTLDMERHIFYVPPNNKYNQSLKQVAAICGIEKNVSSHMARRSYGSLALTHNVPIKVISMIMGHSNTQLLESTYATLTEDKIHQDIEVFKGKLESA